jgi:phosphatidylinositol glycan class M
LFASGDVVAGWLILQLLKRRNVPESKAVVYTSVWLLNPMVCTISTRGSSEGLVGALVISFIWAICTNRIALGGLLAGLAVHTKIYPIIYIPTVLWALDNSAPSIFGKFLNKDRVKFALTSAISFLVLTGIMYYYYGDPFLIHTYLHHLSRIDHRHNFSPYSTLLYISSSPSGTSLSSSLSSSVILGFLSKPSTWAFIPQLGLSGVVLPLAFAKRDVIKTMFLQTVAFVTFNKVCTSQYFMWYMVLLPFYCSSFTFTNKTALIKALVALFLWVASQALWIRNGYLLEFLGVPTFYPGLFVATMLLFVVNCWGLGMFINNL